MMRLKDYLYQPKMRKHLILIILGFAVGVLFYGFHNFKEHPSFWEIVLNGALGIAVSYLFNAVNQFLNQTIDWKKRTGIRLFLGILIHLILGLALVFLSLKAYEVIYPKYNFFSADRGIVFLKIAVVMLGVVLIYNIIYFAFYSYQQYVKGQLVESQLKRKQTELQLKALKSQLSPHFLFNCLNVLSSLVTKNVKASEQFIRSLAKSYEYTLATYQDTLVKVSEELEFVSSYYFLVKTRFQENILLSVNIPEPILNSKIPPLTLQMLVENAIKHNATDSDNTLTIRITGNKDGLEVANNKTKQRLGVKSTRIGLHNIESRYQLIVNKNIIVVNGPSNFCVKLPLTQ